MSTTLDITVESNLWKPAARWRKLVARALDACSAEAGLAWPARPVSFLLCDDAAIRAFNRDWRGKDTATNVLSFPFGKFAQPDAPLGDIVIAFETAAREAHDEDKMLPDHVAHLVVHGALHLLGHDHETDDEAERMEALERIILARLGIADPYAGTAPVAVRAVS